MGFLSQKGSSAVKPKTILFGVTALVLFIYVVLRAFYVSFTFDESFSYDILVGEYYPVMTVNNQWLNTIGAFFMSRTFGFSELSLRFPNVLGFLIYAYFCYKIVVQHSRSSIASVLAIGLLLFNHFLIDYFSLMRGYGLAMSFFAGSVYYFLQALEDTDNKYFFKCILFCVLTIYANYSFLTPILALHAAFFLRLYTKSYRFSDLFGYHFKICLFEVALLIPAGLHLGYIISKGRIYIGGKDFQDTFSSIYNRSVLFNMVENQGWFLFTIALILVLIGGVLSFKRKKLALLFHTLAFSALITIVLHLTVGTSFPMERAALFWVVLTGFVLFFTMQAIMENQRKWLIYATILPMLILTASVVGSFIKNINLNYAQGDARNADTFTMLKMLEAQIDPTQTYNLGVTWSFIVPIKYYKEQKKYNWLNPKVVINTSEQDQDFFFVINEDKLETSNDCLKEIKHFSFTNTAFLENCKK